MSGRGGNTELLQEDGLRAAGSLHGEGPAWTEVNLDNTLFYFFFIYHSDNVLHLELVLLFRETLHLKGDKSWVLFFGFILDSCILSGVPWLRL